MIILRQRFFSEAGKKKLEERALKKANKKKFYKKLLEDDPMARVEVEENVNKVLEHNPCIKKEYVEEIEGLREARKLSRKNLGGKYEEKVADKAASPRRFMSMRKSDAELFAKLPKYENNSIIGRTIRKIRGPKFKDMSRARRGYLHVFNISKPENVVKDIYKHVGRR